MEGFSSNASGDNSKTTNRENGLERPVAQVLRNASSENGSEASQRSPIGEQLKLDNATSASPALSYNGSDNITDGSNSPQVLLNTSGEIGASASQIGLDEQPEFDTRASTEPAFSPRGDGTHMEHTLSHVLLNASEKVRSEPPASIPSTSASEQAGLTNSIPHATGKLQRKVGLKEQTTNHKESVRKRRAATVMGATEELRRRTFGLEEQDLSPTRVSAKKSRTKAQKIESDRPLSVKASPQKTDARDDTSVLDDVAGTRSGGNQRKSINVVDISKASKALTEGEGKKGNATSSASIEAIAATINRLLSDVEDVDKARIVSEARKANEQANYKLQIGGAVDNGFDGGGSSEQKTEALSTEAIRAAVESTLQRDTEKKPKSKEGDKQFSLNFALGKSATLDQKGFEAIVKHRDVAQMRQFLRRIIADSGFIVGDEEELRYLAKACMLGKAPRDFKSLTDAIYIEVTRAGAWIRLFWDDSRRDHKAFAFLKNDNLKVGFQAPLNEDGYKKVKALESKATENMDVFICRVINKLGMEIKDSWGFMGFTPWYDGTNSYQSFDALVAELKSKSWTPGEIVAARRANW
jgi:hypothetical protein